MKDTDKKLWLYEKSSACSLALNTLVAAKRQAASEYDTRIRKITVFHQDILTKLRDGSQLELFDPTEAVSPEVTNLLRNPLNGMD